MTESIDEEGQLRGVRGFNHDPMLRSHRAVALEPVRVVVELRQEDFRALSKASGRVAPADFLRLVALRLASVDGHASLPTRTP